MSVPQLIDAVMVSITQVTIFCSNNHRLQQKDATLRMRFESIIYRLIVRDTGLRLIAEACPASRVTAMDLNGELLNAARQEVAAAGLEQITFVQGDVYAPPLEPGRFDFIYARLLF